MVVDATSTAMSRFVAALPATAGQADRYEHAGRIVALGTGENHLMLGLGEAPLFPNLPTTSSFYYCEACQNGNCAMPVFALTYTVGGGPFRAVRLVRLAPLVPGPFVHAFGQTPTTLQCETTLPADAQMIEGPMPLGIVPMQAGFKIIGLRVELDYFIQIHTDP